MPRLVPNCFGCARNFPILCFKWGSAYVGWMVEQTHQLICFPGLEGVQVYLQPLHWILYHLVEMSVGQMSWLILNYSHPFNLVLRGEGTFEWWVSRTVRRRHSREGGRDTGVGRSSSI